MQARPCTDPARLSQEIVAVDDQVECHDQQTAAKLWWFVWFIWFVLFIWLVWFNQINETNQMNQITIFLCWRTF
jgi:hypothetical protein